MKSLKSQALSGIKWTTTSAVVCSILQIVKMAILARLIAKEDFGLFATISVILGFADFFVEAGLGSAIIHKQDATKTDLAVAYTITIALGWLIFIALYFASPSIASFYGDSRLTPLLHLAILIFLIQPLGRQYDALLRRDLEFNLLAKLDIFASACGFVASLALAWYGFGVRAFIYSQLTITLIRTSVLMWLGNKRYGFNLGFSYAPARFFLRFGAFQICENSVNYFNSQLDTILIGKLLGQEALGVFFMAKQLVFRPIQIINPIINKISLPVFARIQNDEGRLKRGFLHVVHALAVIHFALFTIIAGFSLEIVSIFLGPYWGQAGVLIEIIAFYAMLLAIGNPVGSLLVAKGRVDLGLYWNCALLFYTPPILVVASKWGPTGIAWGLLLSMVGILIPSWYFLVTKLCAASFAEYFGNLLKTFLLALICFGLLLVLANFWLKLLVFFIGFKIYIWYNRSIITEIRSIW